MTNRELIAASITRLNPWIPLLATCAALYCLGIQGWASYTWHAHGLLLALSLAKMQPHGLPEIAAIVGYVTVVMLPIDIISSAFPDVLPAMQVLASLLWIISCMTRTPDVIEWLDKRAP